jgi:hypothetical protein
MAVPISPEIYETPCEDTQDLWTIYQQMKEQLQGFITLKNTLLAEYAAFVASGVAIGGAGDDFTQFAKGGLDGNESYTRKSLLERIEGITKLETDLRKAMAEQRLLAIQSNPTIRIGFGCHGF